MNKLRKFKSALLKSAGGRHHYTWGFVFLFLCVSVFSLSYFFLPSLTVARYEGATVVSSVTEVLPQTENQKAVPKVIHVPTPDVVKGIYMTSCVAGTPSFRADLVKLIEETELNSVIIDIKDFSGTLSFIPESASLKDAISDRCRAPDMREFIQTLHEKGIYVIGRITVFQDPYLVKIHPEFAVTRASDGGIWKDHKGLNFTDPGAKGVWDHIVLISKESYALGFDELNFDYVRFPSDGNMKDIAFPWSGKKPKPEVLREFFSYLHDELKPTGAVLSADLFGMTTTNTDDLNIGQVLEYALPYFDYIMPMVYPSHYPPQFMGFAKPAEKPYEVVKFAMDAAVRRTIATSTVIAIPGTSAIASTTPKLYPKQSFSKLKMRPWLQDFNLGATYTPEMVRAQIQATYDAGLTSWILWSASNRYTAEALKSAPLTKSE